MKYVVFTMAALGVPPLAALLYMNRRWQKYAFWAMLAAMMLYNATSINFFSNEKYPGTSRGMEVSVIHLLAFALLASLKLQGRLRRLVPEAGFALYALYFLLCLPSLTSACDYMVAWYEIWKMLLLYVFYLTVYTYLRATDDVASVLKGFAVYAIVNLALVMKDRFAGVYQAHGAFPHQNSMAMAMQLIGPLFFAAYLSLGVKSRFGRLSAVACTCAAIATLRSYSRGAIAMMPLAYGIPTLVCFAQHARRRRVLKRFVPIAFMGLVGLALLLPKVVERFQEAPEASGNTRVELAHCALEMVRDEPWRGVGINNWSMKMRPPYRYQERASETVGRDLDYLGIVETVYLLVVAECGVPALVAMLVWFLWHWFSCLRLAARLRRTPLAFVPAGLLGGLAAIYLQSCLEWVLRQQINMFLLVFMFAIVAYLNTSWRHLLDERVLKAL